MTTDIGFLTPGHDGLGLRLGIGTKRKTWGNRRNFFRCTHFSIVDSLAMALLNITTCLPTFFLSLTLCVPLVSSPHHSVGSLHWTSHG
jgi:hypothetical protein